MQRSSLDTCPYSPFEPFRFAGFSCLRGSLTHSTRLALVASEPAPTPPCRGRRLHMTDETLGERIERAVGDAIDQAVRDHESGFVTKWVALAESVDAEGTRGLWTMTSDDVKAWDTVGLLQHAMHLQMRQTLNGEWDGDEDDDL